MRDILYILSVQSSIVVYTVLLWVHPCMYDGVDTATATSCLKSYLCTYLSSSPTKGFYGYVACYGQLGTEN